MRMFNFLEQIDQCRNASRWKSDAAEIHAPPAIVATRRPRQASDVCVRTSPRSVAEIRSIEGCDRAQAILETMKYTGCVLRLAPASQMFCSDTALPCAAYR